MPDNPLVGVAAGIADDIALRAEELTSVWFVLIQYDSLSRASLV
jgi:hypothetical protein